MKRVRGRSGSNSCSTEDDEQEEELELLFTKGQPPPTAGQLPPRVLNLQHYVGHSLVKQQQSNPPATFRPLSRTQQQPPNFGSKNHKQGLKLAHSNGSNKQSELTCLQRRAAELTGMPLINFNIKRSASVRADVSPATHIENEATVKPEAQVKFDDFNPHQHPPLYQPHQVHNLVVQQHLRFLSAYQHSGLLAMKNQVVKDLKPGAAPISEQHQDRVLRKNYSMCEDLLMEPTSPINKNPWEKASEEFGYDLDEQTNNRINFKLGATLSLPHMLLVGEVAGAKDLEGFCNRANEFQMGVEDEARFLPTDLLSDEMTTVDKPLPVLAAVDLAPVEIENDYGYTDSKSLPTFLTESPRTSKKSSLRKALSLQGDHSNHLFPTSPSDFSLFPQTSQSDLLCSLRSSLVKNSGSENLEVNNSVGEFEDLSDLDHLPNRKITTSRHLERAIKSLSINTDISRKF